MILAIHLHYLSFLFRQFEGFEFTFDFFFQQTHHELALWQVYFIPFTAAAIVLFYLFGFYNTGRFRRFRHRVGFVSLGVILANFMILLLMHMRIEQDPFPRGITILFFLLTYGFNGMPRLIKPLILFCSKYLQATGAQYAPVKRVLVIGGAGYIGSVLCKQLLQAGYKVRILDLMLFGEEALKHHRSYRNFEVLQGDCRNVGDVLPALEDVDAVVHLAGLVGDPACAVNHDLTVDINLAATQMLMQLCKAHRIQRFIFASSCSVYGVSDKTLTEDSELNPVSLYAQTKIDSEKILLKASSFDFYPTILRFATVFGLSARQRFDLVVNTFVGRALKHKKIEVFGGNQWRPFVHVFDIGRFIIKALQADPRTVGGQIFNVGDDRLNKTITQLSELVKEHLPGTEVVNKGDVSDPRNYRVSFKKAKKVLGFECIRDLETGIQEVAKAYRPGGDIEFSSADYSNVDQVKAMLAEGSDVVRNRIFKAKLFENDWTEGEDFVLPKVVGGD